MRLHRTENADWDNLAPDKYNAWQNLAVRSHGVLTPGNIISLLGTLIALWGLWLIYKDQLLPGVIILLMGRFADILDGVIADITKTKSWIGEGVDASLDKVVLVLSLVVLLDKSFMPLWVGLIILVQALYNSVLALVAKSHGVKLHPSLIGKLSAALLWLSIALYILAVWINPRHPSAHYSVEVAAALSFIGYIILAIGSSIGYSKEFK